MKSLDASIDEILTQFDIISPMVNCIFCKLVKNEIPAAKVYEDNQFLAFLDIKPVSDGHLLVIPKEHVVWMQEATDELVAGIFKIAKKLMLALKKLPCDYVQVSVVGNEVPHFHVHLIPRYHGDQFKNFRAREYYSKEKEAELVQKITANLE
jgi:histidine triad (HIT) family protein